MWLDYVSNLQQLSVFLPMSCRSFTSVPKDYANSSAGTTKIALSILPAKSEHKKGTVFFNPGGPGVRGKPYIIEKGDILQRVVSEIFLVDTDSVFERRHHRSGMNMISWVLILGAWGRLCK